MTKQNKDGEGGPRLTFRFAGFRSPNYTIVPDELFDELLTVLTGAELKVLLYIIRRTFGFKQDQDSISLSQMLNGITTRDGRVLDKGVGISKPTLLQAVRSLEEQNIIETERQRSVEKGDEPTIYRLKLLSAYNEIADKEDRREKNIHPLVKKVDQGGGKESRPGGRSNFFTTQETVKQETELINSNIRRVSPIEKNENEPINLTPRPERLDASIPRRFTSTQSNSQHNEHSEHSEQGRGRTPSDGFEGAGSVLGHVLQPPPSRPDEARQVILEYIEDFAREFSDQAPLKSSTSRAYNLFKQSGLPVGAFISRMQEARSITKESTAQIRSEVHVQGSGAPPAKKKMAYWFSVLEDLLGLKEQNEQGENTTDRVQQSS